LDLWFKSYEVFKISAQVGACCQPLLTPKIPCGFWTKQGSFVHSWRNHFP
jgi:hypothetical protein